MGVDVHVVVDGADHLLSTAQAWIEALDARWSRFRPDSEISRLNRAGGRLTIVSEPTFRLIHDSMEGHRRTAGAFDPSLLGSVIRAGYDNDFDHLAPDRPLPPSSDLRAGVAGTVLFPTSRAVMLPVGVGFDPGGIGKGLAADLAADLLRRAGAAGGCINVGGDLRVFGCYRGEPSWPLAVEPPLGDGDPIPVVMTGGGLATTGVTRRRWLIAGQPRHHVIDPATGHPAETDLLSVSVVADTGWEAEVLATAGFLAGADRCLAVVGAGGGGALAFAVDGAVLASPRFARAAPVHAAVGA